MRSQDGHSLQVNKTQIRLVLVSDNPKVARKSLISDPSQFNKIGMTIRDEVICKTQFSAIRQCLLRIGCSTYKRHARGKGLWKRQINGHIYFLLSILSIRLLYLRSVQKMETNETSDHDQAWVSKILCRPYAV